MTEFPEHLTGVLALLVKQNDYTLAEVASAALDMLSLAERRIVREALFADADGSRARRSEWVDRDTGDVLRKSVSQDYGPLNLLVRHEDGSATRYTAERGTIEHEIQIDDSVLVRTFYVEATS